MEDGHHFCMQHSFIGEEVKCLHSQLVNLEPDRETMPIFAVRKAGIRGINFNRAASTGVEEPGGRTLRFRDAYRGQRRSNATWHDDR